MLLWRKGSGSVTRRESTVPWGSPHACALELLAISGRVSWPIITLASAVSNITTPFIQSCQDTVWQWFVREVLTFKKNKQKKQKKKPRGRLHECFSCKVLQVHHVTAPHFRNVYLRQQGQQRFWRREREWKGECGEYTATLPLSSPPPPPPLSPFPNQPLSSASQKFRFLCQFALRGAEGLSEQTLYSEEYQISCLCGVDGHYRKKWSLTVIDPVYLLFSIY